MSVTRRVATVWQALRAYFPTFASPATDATDILEVRRVSLTISRAPLREHPYANVKMCDVWTATDGRQA